MSNTYNRHDDDKLLRSTLEIQIWCRRIPLPPGAMTIRRILASTFALGRETRSWENGLRHNPRPIRWQGWGGVYQNLKQRDSEILDPWSHVEHKYPTVSHLGI